MQEGLSPRMTGLFVKLRTEVYLNGCEVPDRRRQSSFR